MKLKIYDESGNLLESVDQSKGYITPKHEEDSECVFHEYGKEERIRYGIIAKVNELRDKLSSTDYQAIKFAEGQLTEDEFAPIRKQRQAWRDEINELEKNIK